MTQVALPDGRTLELSGNETPEQLNALKNKLRQTYVQPAQQPTRKLEPQTPTRGRTALERGLQGATFGFADEIIAPLAATGAALMQEPSAIFSGQIQNPYLSEQISTIPQQMQKQQQMQMEKFPLTSIGAEIGGSLLTGGAAATTKAGQALTRSLGSGKLLQRMVKGAAVGAVPAGLYGAGVAQEGERLRGAGEAAVLGGAVGGVIPAAGSIGRAVMPKVSEGLADITQAAQKYKIPLSLDQVSDSRALKNIQKVSQELPFSGQDAFRDTQMKAYNKALLKTIGQEGDSFNRFMADKAFFDVGKKFDSFAKGKVLQTNDMVGAINNLLEEAPEFATKDAIDIVKRNVDNILFEIKDNTIKGEKLNKFRSKVNEAVRKANAVDAKELLRDLENIIIDNLAKDDKGAMAQAKQQYKNLLVLEPLMAKAKGGDISPTQLTNRVTRIYGRQFVRGKAGEIGELADIGRELLPELGGSDTAQKTAYMLGTGASMVDPFGAGAIVSSGLGLNRAMQSFVNRNQRLISQLTPRQQQKIMLLSPTEAAKTLGRFTATGALAGSLTQGKQ